MHDLAACYRERIPPLKALGTSLEEAALAQLRTTSHIDRVAFRVKSVESFVDKATKRKRYECPLADIEDQVAGRIIVFFLGDIAPVAKLAEERFHPVEAARREPQADSEFGYESFQAVYLIPPELEPPGWLDIDDRPTTFELQIRTVFQHAYAEPQHDAGYKPSHPLDRTDRRELAWIAASAWGADQTYERWRTRIQARP